MEIIWSRRIVNCAVDGRPNAKGPRWFRLGRLGRLVQLLIAKPRYRHVKACDDAACAETLLAMFLSTRLFVFLFWTLNPYCRGETELVGNPNKAVLFGTRCGY